MHEKQSQLTEGSGGSSDSTLTLLLKMFRNSNKLFVYFLCGSIVHLDKS